MGAGSSPTPFGTGGRLAVIVPCHDDGAFLPATIASIQESEPVEVVVVDDASTDTRTRTVLTKLERVGVTVIRHDVNKGVSAARMTGLAASSAPLVFPLDADDLLLDGVLAPMADRLEAADSGVCFGDYVELGPKRLLLRAVPERIDPFRLAYTNEFPASALFSRTTLESVGGWQSLGAGIDARSDWSLWLTLGERGVKGVHLGAGEITYMRRMHPGRLASRSRAHHRELRSAIRAAHPQTYDNLSRHREASGLRHSRKRLYPLVYSSHFPGLDRRMKAALDQAGVWTLQRELDDAKRARLLERARWARAAGARLIEAPPTGPPPPLAARPPVIVIGSGRSGTAYVSRILEGLGIFMGKVQDPNAEAFHFIRLNTALLSRAGVSWSNPEILAWLLEDERVRTEARGWVLPRLRAPFGAGYLGWVNLLRYRSILGYDRPWGWKDPRNTFTLPLWLDLFPDAKVIHVLRHGADVAGSLWRQQDRPRRFAFLLSATAKRRYHLPTILREARVWWRTKSHFPRVTRFTSPGRGIELWATYTREATRQAEALGDGALEIRFEELLTEPEAHIRRIAAFCDVPAPDAIVAELAADADRSRAFAFRRDPALSELAAGNEEILAPHGYSAQGWATASGSEGTAVASETDADG
jgi:glycosyltransferase involved in cell wall biosynthesis